MSKVITKQDLNKVFWRGIFMQFSWNYERMQALGYCWTILPVLKKIYLRVNNSCASCNEK